MRFNRRDLLKSTAAGFALSQVPLPAWNLARAQALDEAAPLSGLSGSFASMKFNGDNEDIPHDLLWDRGGFIAKMGGIPRATESCDLIVVGGGVAGLTAVNATLGRDIICLEQAPQFGGNAKGEKYGSHSFALGSAYVCPPEDGDELHSLLKDLGLDKKLRTEVGAPVFMNGRFVDDVSKVATSAKSRKEIERVQSKLREVNEKYYPEIPLSSDRGEADATRALDGITFEQWLAKELGPLDPIIHEYIQLYCWSSFNASIEELSAAQALNFLAAEVDGVSALPGGNAALTDALYRKIAKNSRVSLRASSFVVDVQLKSDRVVVCTYENKKLKTIEASKCIFAAPKFILDEVMPTAPKAVLDAAASITYRAYLVANVALTKPVSLSHYDIYTLEGAVPPAPAAMRPPERAFTDVISADWAANGSSTQVLTIYQPLAYDGARQFLFNPGAHDKYRDWASSELAPVLAGLGLSKSDVAGIRMTRWGHAVPVAERGFVAGPAPALFDAGIGGRLFFAGQDNWANPALETALKTGLRAASRV